jgi:DNA mismatch endonuclease (patch repair protein)
MDRLSPRERSAMMQRVRSRDSGPEMIVRRLVHAMGYRYRLHAAHLPGRPDLVLSVRGKVVFVHGCFWHQHPRCPKSARPRSNMNFWRRKLDANVARDRRNITELQARGWQTLVIWECELRDPDRVGLRLRKFLG